MSTTVNFVSPSETNLSNSRHVYPPSTWSCQFSILPCSQSDFWSWPHVCLKTHQICFPCSRLHVSWYQSNVLKPKTLESSLSLLSHLHHIQPFEKTCWSSFKILPESKLSPPLCTRPQPLVRVTVISRLDCYGASYLTFLLSPSLSVVFSQTIAKGTLLKYTSDHGAVLFKTL